MKIEYTSLAIFRLTPTIQAAVSACARYVECMVGQNAVGCVSEMMRVAELPKTNHNNLVHIGTIVWAKNRNRQTFYSLYASSVMQ